MTAPDALDSHAVDLSVQVGAVSFRNPILVASGTFGHGLEVAGHVDVRRLGAVIGKTITPEPRAGNPPPRWVETSSGMLNAIGLQNDGLEAYVTRTLPYLQELGTPVIPSIAGFSPADYVRCARRLGDRGVAALELNLSCPNVEAGGRSIACSETLTAEVVAAVRAAVSVPLWAKLSPNVTDVAAVARAAHEAGADVLSLINTYVGMAVDWRRRRPCLSHGTGGLSGPAIKPLALWQVYQVASSVSAPVVGIGGIASADDVLEFLVAGASAVQVGTASFVDPSLPVRLVDQVAEALASAGISRVADLVGTLQMSEPPAAAAAG